MTATAPEPTGPTVDERDPNRTIYWIIAGVLVVLVIIGLITYNAQEANAEARDKAQQLTQAFRDAGLRVPQHQDILIRSLGDDGGAVCDNPGNALGRAILFDQLVNGAASVGRRPIIADSRVLAGEALILQIYCPEKLQEFRDKFDDLKFDDTIKD